MTDIDIKGLAKRLRMAKCPDYHTAADLLLEALTFKQEVSDALLEYYGGYHNASGEPLERFIIPKLKPDPLVEAIEKCAAQMHLTSEDAAKELCAALDALGFEIRSKNDDRHHTQTSRDRCDCESKVGSV